MMMATHVMANQSVYVRFLLDAPLLAVGRIAVLRFYVQDWLKDRPGAAPSKK